VSIVAGVADREMAGLLRLRNRYASSTVVLFHASSWDANVSDVPGGTIGRGVIMVTRQQPFAETWNSAMHPRTRTFAVAR